MWCYPDLKIRSFPDHSTKSDGRGDKAFSGESGSFPGLIGVPRSKRRSNVKRRRSSRNLKNPFPLPRVVKKGDNLFRLTKKVYGYADDKLIERVRQNNPRIKDVNKILIGDEIVFPELSQNQVKAKEPKDRG